MNWYKQSQFRDKEFLARQEEAKLATGVYVERGGVGGNERYFKGWSADWRNKGITPVWTSLDNAKNFIDDAVVYLGRSRDEADMVFLVRSAKASADWVAKKIEEEEGYRPSVYVDKNEQLQDSEAFPGENTHNTQVDLMDVYEQGWHNYMDGGFVTENPYDIDPIAKAEWERGYNDAQAKHMEEQGYPSPDESLRQSADDDFKHMDPPEPFRRSM